MDKKSIKILTVVNSTIPYVIFVLAFLDMMNFYKTAIIYQPLLILMLIFNGLAFFKSNKKASIVCFVTGFIVMVCYVMTLVI